MNILVFFTGAFFGATVHFAIMLGVIYAAGNRSRKGSGRDEK